VDWQLLCAEGQEGQQGWRVAFNEAIFNAINAANYRVSLMGRSSMKAAGFDLSFLPPSASRLPSRGDSMDIRDSSVVFPEASEAPAASAVSAAGSSGEGADEVSGQVAQGQPSDDPQHQIEPPVVVAPLYAPRTQSQSSGGNNPFRRLQPVLRLDDGEL
jgi:hypothetical protein